MHQAIPRCESNLMNEFSHLLNIGWLFFCTGLLIIVPKEMSPHPKHYLHKTEFLRHRKKYIHVVRYFEIFRVLWIIGAVLTISRLMQDYPNQQMTLFMLLVPAVGLGIVLSFLEMYYGLSVQIDGKHKYKTIIFSYRPGRRLKLPSWYRVDKTKLSVLAK